MALVLALSALVFAPVASAKEAPTVTTYLATGDSLAFGYTQEKFAINKPNESPSYFEGGYANVFTKKTLYKESKGITLVNNGCPGETTDSFIGTGPLGKSVDPTGTQACPYHFLSGLPLHNSLATLSQLEDSLSVLNPCFTVAKVCAPPHEVKAVTLDIGSNDELASVAKCKAEVKSEFETTGKSKYEQAKDKSLEEKVSGSVLFCIVVSSPATFSHITENVETVLGLIRSPSYGNYAGKIVLLGFYNPDALLLPGSDALQISLNKQMEEAGAKFGAKFANPFAKINPTPEGGPKEIKAIAKYTEMNNANDIAANKAACEANKAKEEGELKTVIYPCTPEGDIHPSPAGAALLGKLIGLAYP